MNRKQSRIALGTWSWGTGAIGGDQIFGNHLQTEDLRPVFEVATESGINLWDTATAYAMGASEEILGTFARELNRDEIVLSTKFTPQLAELYGNSVERMCMASMERLGVDHIDMYWIHNPLDVERWTPQLLPLLEAGKVRRVGVSNHSLEQIQRAEAILAQGGFGVSAVQSHYSLLYRACEHSGILAYCLEKRIEFWSYMVLEQGALSGQYHPGNPLPAGSLRGERYNPILPQIEILTERMRSLGEKYGASVSQVAIAWAIAKGTTPIIGATKTKHVVEAAGAIEIALTEQEVKELEALADQTGVNTRGGWEQILD